MKEKIFTIILLTGFIIPLVMNEIMFRVECVMNYVLFSEHISAYTSDQIKTITITDTSAFHWERKNKEFLLDSKLYDVISIENSPEGMIIRCVPDHKEDRLVSSYLKSVGHHSENKSNRTLIPKLKVKLFHQKIPSIHLPEILYTNIAIVLIQHFPLSPFIKIFSPPPEH